MVLDKLELIDGPALLDTVEEVLEDSLTSCLSQDVLDDLVSTEEIGVPQVAKMEIGLFSSDLQLREHLFPVLGLHRITSQFGKDVVDLLVRLEMAHVCLVDFI